jgi:ATP-dependent exoDNAse (exonuclease V) alpha subunit
MYHLRVKFVKRSEGRSSVAAAAYRAGEKLHDERAGVTHDYTRKGGIEHTEVLLPENIPAQLANRETLWNTVEAGSPRKDAQLAFEVEVALPRELSHEKRVELARTFAQEQLVAKGLIELLPVSWTAT